MIYKIHFEDKVINFTQNEPSYEALLWRDGSSSPPAVAEVVERMEKNPECFIISDDPERSFREFSLQFLLMEAGGGLVRRRESEVLMILRNGRWDLPKGHIEPGEGPEECALREVAEETGIAPSRSNGLITVTYHIYPFHGRWMLKKCWWYAMEYDGADTPVPQREEGITDVRWLGGTDLAWALVGSYATIREVTAISEETIDENE